MADQRVTHMRFATLLLLALTLFSTAAPGAADTILLVADEWCPYNCNPASGNEGYLVDIAREVFESKGHAVRYRIMPWKRSIATVADGTATGLIGASHAEVPDFIFPDCVLGYYTVTFFTRKESRWKFSGVESLNGMRVAACAGYTYGRDIDAYINKSQRVILTSGDNAEAINVQALANGHVDVIISDPGVITYQARRINVSDAIQNAGTAGSIQLSIAFSPSHGKSKEYAAMLCEGVKHLRRSGRLQAIMAKYGLNAWESAE